MKWIVIFSTLLSLLFSGCSQKQEDPEQFNKEVYQKALKLLEDPKFSLGKYAQRQDTVLSAIERAFCDSKSMKELFGNTVEVCEKIPREDLIIPCLRFKGLRNRNLCYSAYLITTIEISPIIEDYLRKTTGLN